MDACEQQSASRLSLTIRCAWTAARVSQLAQRQEQANVYQMRQLLGFAIAIICAIRPTAVQAHSSPEASVDVVTRAELEETREAVWRAFFAGDTVKLAALIPPALAAGDPFGCNSRAPTIAYAVQSAASGNRLVELLFDSTTITVHGSVAVMHAKYEYVLEDRSGRRRAWRGRATEVFVREGGRWVNPLWYLE